MTWTVMQIQGNLSGDVALCEYFNNRVWTIYVSSLKTTRCTAILDILKPYRSW